MGVSTVFFSGFNCLVVQPVTEFYFILPRCVNFMGTL